ncbi:hypothetical protein MKX01_022263 [Papaver californicum]|nr:hypothetical protein MKX01_022263 [Papaver californicum]
MPCFCVLFMEMWKVIWVRTEARCCEARSVSKQGHDQECSLSNLFFEPHKRRRLRS